MTQPSDYVYLQERRHRGWPWPEESWGLTPLFGEEGWCRACGTPKHEQTGSLVLQRRSLTVTGAWVPNWQYDVLCLEQSLADEIAERYALDLRPVVSPRGDDLGAMQLVFPTLQPNWYEAHALRRLAFARHGRDGATCAQCGVWRWLPIPAAELPPPRTSDAWHGMAAVASPEVFGDGWKTFRQTLLRRDFAEFIVSRSPREFTVREV